MFLHSINIVTTDMCVQEPDTFVAITKASTSLAAVFPYLNSIIPNADYNSVANSIKFRQGKIEFTLVNDEVNIAKFRTRTELHELLDWMIDLINDTYDSREEIEPNYETKQTIPSLAIYSLLPKTNCKQCGALSCMAFASRLSKRDAAVEDCPPLQQRKYITERQKLKRMLG